MGVCLIPTYAYGFLDVYQLYIQCLLGSIQNSRISSKTLWMIFLRNVGDEPFPVNPEILSFAKSFFHVSVFYSWVLGKFFFLISKFIYTLFRDPKVCQIVQGRVCNRISNSFYSILPIMSDLKIISVELYLKEKHLLNKHEE